MAQIELVINANGRTAVTALKKMSDAQNKIATATKKAGKAARGQANATGRQTAASRKHARALSFQERAQKKINRSFGRLAAKFGGIAALGAVATGASRAISIQTEELKKFEETLTPLLSLGDNVDNIAKIKKEVLALSNATGQARPEIAKFLFDLQSGTGGLSDAIREDLKKESIELARVTGGDLPVALTTLIKTYTIYRDELDDVNQAQNKLLITQEKGFLTFKDLATLLPDVLPAAKAFGNTLDEVLGTLIVATQVGGRSEKTFTGVRNVFLRMNNAAKEGIPLTGTFTDKLEQLANVDPDTLKKIFGDESISVIVSLIQEVDNLKKSIQEVADVSGDVAKSKLFKRLGGDRESAIAEVAKSAAAGTENAIVSGGSTEADQRKRLNQILFKRGFAESFPRAAKLTPDIMEDISADILGLIRNTGISQSSRFVGVVPHGGGDLIDRGRIALIGDALDAGDIDRANFLRKFLRDTDAGVSPGAIQRLQNSHSGISVPSGFDRAAEFAQGVSDRALEGGGESGEATDKLSQALDRTTAALNKNTDAKNNAGAPGGVISATGANASE